MDGCGGEQGSDSVNRKEYMLFYSILYGKEFLTSYRISSLSSNRAFSSRYLVVNSGTRQRVTTLETGTIET
jgi:hypothetical protein